MENAEKMHVHHNNIATTSLEMLVIKLLYIDFNQDLVRVPQHFHSFFRKQTVLEKVTYLSSFGHGLLIHGFKIIQEN
jgi:hypothetical protein